MKKTLFEKALATTLHSRFVARADDLNRDLTDDEVRSEAEYLLETIPYAGAFEGKELTKVKAELKRLMKG